MIELPGLTGLAFWLPLICAGVVGLAVGMYVVLDGFDLGVGILFPFFPREAERDQMMNSVAPFWDGNETWLILGGNGLFVAFPLAYAIIMPALYIPLIAMLLALVFRGVAFEFRWVAKPHHRKWDISFASGSIVAAFTQGLMLGALLEGIKVKDRQFGGGPFDWLTPFTVMCGLGLIAGYALIGACWLQYKLLGEIEKDARRFAKITLVALLAFVVIVSVWTPMQFKPIAARWFSWPNVAYLAPVPVITGLLALGCWRGIAARKAGTALLCAIGLFVMALLGILISTFPAIVPPALTLWEAAAAPDSQLFLLTGTAILLPFILGYTVFVYYTFRGKLKSGEGYH